MQEVGITDELEFPATSTPPTYDDMQKFVAAAGQELTKDLERLNEAILANGRGAMRAGKSLQALHEEATVPGIYRKPDRVWVEPTYKQRRAKLKKQKRKNGGPR
jgi:hypothetical protein